MRLSTRYVVESYMDYCSRHKKVEAELAKRGLDALFVTHLPNVRYLCGFTGSAGVLVVRPPHWTLFTDGRYTQQARDEVKGMRLAIAKGHPLIAAAEHLRNVPVKHLGIEAEYITVASRSALRQQLSKNARLRETIGLVESLRLIKEPEEIDRTRAAVNLGSLLLKPALAAIDPGVSELTVAAEIEFAARKAGAEAMSFETVVTSGLRTALPHGRASLARIPRSGFVLMDFGVILGGYCSDMTRTVYVGKPSREMRNVYEAVREAQLAAVEAVGPGVQAGTVDHAARRVLQKAGLARFFTHSTGHGVGLEIHEAPRIARNTTHVLQPGMVITVEPGVYIAGKGGVRIEDMVLVTGSGHEVLTAASKDFISL